MNSVLDWDNKEVKKTIKKTLKKRIVRAIEAEFKFVELRRSEAFETYLKGIAEASSSNHALQIAIRTSPVTPSEFDCNLHEDFRIAEKIFGHL